MNAVMFLVLMEHHMLPIRGCEKMARASTITNNINEAIASEIARDGSVAVLPFVNGMLHPRGRVRKYWRTHHENHNPKLPHRSPRHCSVFMIHQNQNQYSVEYADLC